MFNYKNSISFKIILILLICTICITTVTGFIFYFVNSEKMIGNLNVSANRILDRLSHNLLQPLWEYNIKQLEALIDLETGDDIVGSIVLHEKSGMFIGRKKNRDGKLIDLKKNEPGERYLFTLVKKIEKDGNFLGLLELNIVDRSIRLAATELIRTTILQTFVFSLAIISVIFISFKSVIINPVQQLLNIVNEIEKGNLNVQDNLRHGEDEIGKFGVALENMALKLNSLLNELSQKNKELESIVYVASHDLRSPLINIQGFSQRLEDSCEKLFECLSGLQLPEEARLEIDGVARERIPRELEFIKTSCSKMNSLINGLLSISRTGRLPLKIEMINMNELMDKIKTAMAIQIENAGAEVKIAGLPSCFGDAEQINQVFSNLIDNALKYRDPQRPLTIDINGETAGNESIYSVSDNGAGINQNHQEKIWELFHRLNPKGPIHGEGLGLTLIRRIVNRHNGRTWVESTLGEGSRFFVTIPNVYGKNKKGELSDRLAALK